MNLIDTHAHLYWDSYKDEFDEVIQRSIDAGVTTIINVGVDVELSKKALQQAKQLKSIMAYSTIGIHPHEALRYAQGKLDIEELEQIYLSAPEKVVAVGECGLDYLDVDEKIKAMQKKLYQAQVDLAKKIHLPLIIHCRNAWDDIFPLLKNTTGILHCYSGDTEITKKALQTGYLFSFAGNVTYPKNDWLRESIKIIPLDRIVLETDCPFLPPQSKRGQRNEPANVLEIAQLIAQLKAIPIDKVASQTTVNAGKIFAFQAQIH